MAKTQFILMNKDHAVACAEYDLDSHVFTKVLNVTDARYASPLMLEPTGEITTRTLNKWWRNRSIPASRNQLKALLQGISEDSALALAEKNFGLSLSDRYWLNNDQNSLTWQEINYFDNDFSDDLGLHTLGQTSSGHMDLMNPSATAGGNLQKKWTIQNGERVLVKAGSGLFDQEVYNEVAATALHRRILQPGEFVPYALYEEDGQAYSACPNMLHADEELITAFDLLANRKKPNNFSDFRFLVEVLEEIGIDRPETALAKIFASDYIIGNFDRHYQNFGVIRNVETLEFTRIAPIYDSGMSFWMDKRRIEKPMDYKYEAKPFKTKGRTADEQLQLFEDFKWLDSSRLSGYAQQAKDILSENPLMPEDRIKLVGAAVDARIEALLRYAESPERWSGWLPPIPKEIL